MKEFIGNNKRFKTEESQIERLPELCPDVKTVESVLIPLT